MGDVDGCHAELALQRCDLGACLHAELRVEVRERFVHEEHLRFANDRSPHRHSLALAAREIRRLAIEEFLEIEDAGSFGDPGRTLLLAHLLDLQVEADVLGHGHVRVQRVRLEDHGDVAILRRHERDVAVADEHVSLVDRLQAGEHP